MPTVAAAPSLCDALTERGAAAAPPARRPSRRAPQADDGRAAHLAGVRALGLTHLVDAHSHWFPENVERKIWRYFDDHYWPITYRGSHAERVEWMRRNGVARFTVLTYAHRPAMAAWLNEWVAGFCADVAEAVPCGTFYPEPAAAGDVRRCIEEFGMRGFKLHVQVGDFDPAAEVLAPAFEQIEHAGLPVVIHIGDAPRGSRHTTPAGVERLLARHPRLKLVVAHMGASQFAAYLELAERHPGLALDTTMIFVGRRGLRTFPRRLLPRLEALAPRLLFGSDFPAIPYPLGRAVEGVLRLPLSAGAKRAVLAGNAARWFGLRP